MLKERKGMEYEETNRKKKRKIKVVHIDGDVQRYTDNKKLHKDAIKELKTHIKLVKKDIKKHKLLYKQVKLSHKINKVK